MSNQINGCRNLGKSILDVIEMVYDDQTRQNLEIMFEPCFGVILAKIEQKSQCLEDNSADIYRIVFWFSIPSPLEWL